MLIFGLTPAGRRKIEWSAMPASFFETLTFGELKVGDMFISVPTPGDNDGHGGLKGAHYIFKKTEENTLTSTGQPYGIPTGSAVNVHRNLISDFPHSMSVLHVQ